MTVSGYVIYFPPLNAAQDKVVIHRAGHKEQDTVSALMIQKLHYTGQDTKLQPADKTLCSKGFEKQWVEHLCWLWAGCNEYTIQNWNMNMK